MSAFLAAAIQLNASSDQARNLEQFSALVRRAARYGASLVATPENTNFLGPHHEKVRRAEPIGGPTCAVFSGLARELQIHLLIGSFNEASGDPSRCANTSLLYGPDGGLIASYRKIHLFDVHVSDEVHFIESNTVTPGAQAVVARTELAPIGLSICYDLRFPELYAKLVQQGATVLAIPAAFTLSTGKDHWEALIRARAIETQSYVIAPGQWGAHDDDGLRNSYGHSMIVDPWGHVIARASDGPGMALAEIDLARVTQVRAGMPLATHRAQRPWRP